MNQNYINHIALVLDASYSMGHLASQVVKVADNQIKYLAQRSRELDQETRITVYTFNERVECVIYDKDVLRLPSISKHYSTRGMTALVDAAIKSQDDLSHTAELYGDHAFLTYILTDGQENASRKKSRDLQNLLSKMPDHWTMAVMVPNQNGVFEAKKFGFPTDNIAVWDSTNSQGLEEAGSTIRRTTDSFMTQRQTGVRGYRNIFSMGAENLNKRTVTTALKALAKNKYKLIDVITGDPLGIRDFVWDRGLDYYPGVAYYQLSKTEDIQPQKQICVVDKATRKVYKGDQARDILGLPNQKIRVHPTFNPQYDVFVQSTSVNRKLVPGTKLLVLS